jgi:acetyl-CoA decarbonylase/synthase complex subunit epsilon
VPQPFHKINVLTGLQAARPLDDGSAAARIIQKAARPLLILGALTVRDSLAERPLVDWALDLARAGDIPICATAHTSRALIERDFEPDSRFDLMEIIRALIDPSWSGVRGQGAHDLVLFFGVRSDLATAGLATLKHYAGHLKTMTLCRHHFPQADYSPPNFRRDEPWAAFLTELIDNLSTE